MLQPLPLYTLKWSMHDGYGRAYPVIQLWHPRAFREKWHLTLRLDSTPKCSCDLQLRQTCQWLLRSLLNTHIFCFLLTLSRLPFSLVLPRHNFPCSSVVSDGAGLCDYNFQWQSTSIIYVINVKLLVSSLTLVVGSNFKKKVFTLLVSKAGLSAVVFLQQHFQRHTLGLWLTYYGIKTMWISFSSAQYAFTYIILMRKLKGSGA